MKTFNFIGILLLLSVTILSAVTEVDLISSSTSQLQLQVHNNDFELKTDQFYDDQFYTQILPNLGKLIPGQPDLPQVNRWIAVPNGAKIDLSFYHNETINYDDISLVPVQTQRRDKANAPIPEFVMDMEIYKRAAFYPSEIVSIERKIIKNGQEYALVKVSPFQYNPITKNLILHENIHIDITFSGGTMANSITGSAINVLNKNILSNSNREFVRDRTNGYDMLIITDEIFVDAVEKLALWKEQLGMKTIIVTTQEIGSSANQIETYIDNSIAEWDLDPSYLLLFGDAEFIPPFYENIHPYTDGGQGYTGTDIYYADLQDDLVADLAYGRIPIDTAAEADSIVTRIIRYEKNPPQESSYYQDAIAAAYFQEQDSGNGVAERRFAKTSEDYRNFLESVDYDIERIYVTDNPTDPEYWNDGAYVFENDIAGESLPAELKRPFFAWDGDANDIINSVNSGKFLLLHRDHGWRQGWGDPSFNNYNVNQLDNGDLRPIVWTINCETGWFDNETDDNSSGTGVSAESFTEAWLRHETGGSVGLIGATRVSYSGNNDRLIWGVMDAIWPEYLDWATADYPENEAIYSLGEVVNYAKEYLMTSYSWGDDILVCALEEFSYFGDPSMQIYTQEPDSIFAEHVGLISFGMNEMAVGCNIEDALVTLVYNNEIVGKSYVSGGQAVLELDSIEEIGEAYLTVSKHNYRPYVSEILVQPEGAYIKTEIISIEETGDFVDGSIQSLDILNFSIMMQNIGSEDSGELEFNLSCADDRIAIIDGEIELSQIIIGESISIDSAFQVELLQDIADSTVVLFEVNCTDQEAEWTDGFEIIVHAANLIFTDYEIETDNENSIVVPGSSAEIAVTIENIGSGNAYLVDFALDTDSEFASIEGLDQIAELSSGTQYSSEPFVINVNSDYPVDTYLTMNYDLVDNSGLYFTGEISHLVGVLLYDFENGEVWEHEALGADFGDQWHLSDQTNYSLYGNHTYKFGSENEDNYEMSQYGALYVPQFQVGPGAFLRFWHKMNAGHQINPVSWDGGILEISVDDSDFEQIFPIGNYPGTSMNLPTSPFAAETQFYTGHFSWEEAEFDLSAYEGSAVVRFVFGSSSMPTSEGWYIDDLRFGILETTNVTEDEVETLKFASTNFPNPFNPVTTISFTVAYTDAKVADISIYNLKGQLVKQSEVPLNSNSKSYNMIWEGDDSIGNSVGSGVYFYQIKVGVKQLTRKMMLLK